MYKKKTIATFFFYIIVFVPAVKAIDIEAVSGRLGVVIINNQNDELPFIPVTNTIGASLVLSFKKDAFITLDPALDLYWTNYKWQNGYAVPTESESGAGNNCFVMGFILDLPWTASFNFNDRTGAAFSLGTAFILRAAFANDNTPGTEAEMDSNQKAIIKYFWEKGRWFYPSASLRFDAYLQEKFSFSFNVRGMLALANAWTNPGLFFNESMLHIFMAMAVSL